MKNTRVPTKITLDAYAVSHRAVREMKENGELPRRVKVRSSQYLNNVVEQDHRRVKQRIRPMLGFKRFDNAAVTISGIELAEIKKDNTKWASWAAERRRSRSCATPHSLLEPIAGRSAKRSPIDLLVGLSLHQSLHKLVLLFVNFHAACASALRYCNWLRTRASKRARTSP
jgi:hypothetical protein